MAGSERAFHWFVVATFVHCTNAVLAIVNGPTGLLSIAVWFVIYGVSAALLVDDVLRRRRRVVWHPLSLVLVLLALASTYWSADRLVSSQASVLLVGTLLVATTVAHRMSPVGVLRALRTAMCLIAVASLSLYLIGAPQAVDEVYGTLRGVLVQKNSLGQAMMLGILASALAATLDPRRWRSDLLAAVPMLVALALTDSASALLLTAVGLCVLTAVWLRKLHPYLLGAAVLLLIPLGLGAAFVLRLTTAALFGVLGRDATFTGRTDIWAESLRAARERPFLGYGNDAFWEGARAAADIRIRLKFQVAHAHNGLLDIGLELGLVGVVLVIALLVGLAFSAGRQWILGRLDIAAFQVGVVTIAVAVNVGESGLFNENNLVTLLILIAVALPRAVAVRSPRKPAIVWSAPAPVPVPTG